jgi:hypothetical protein
MTAPIGMSVVTSSIDINEEETDIEEKQCCIC